MTTPDRKKQVKTTRERYGAEHYQKIGKLGSEKSTTKFNSETASAAVAKRWAKKEIKKEKDNSGESIQ